MAQTREKIIFLELTAYLALLISALIYAFYREPSTYFAFLLQKVYANKLYIYSSTHLPISYAWVVFSLPSGLWVMASTIFGNFLRKRNSLFVYLPITLVLGIELFQLLGITDGVFDYLDIIISILGFCIAKECKIAINTPQKRWYVAYGICVLVVPLSDVM